MVFPDITPYVPLLGPYDFNIGSWHVGPIGVRWYALAYIFGIFAGWRYCVGLIRNDKLWGGRQPTLTAVQFDDLLVWITLGVILGGRIGSVLFYRTASDSADPWEALKIWHGGMSFHGGLIGVTLALLLFAWRNKVNVLRLSDVVAPGVPFGLFFGRIANFINAELWGRPTHLPWGMVFCNKTIRSENVSPDYPLGYCPAGLEPRHPSQLYEATLEGIVLFLALRWATHYVKWLRRDGAVTGLFLTLYGLFRILLENVRQPDKGLDNMPFGLTMGILLSVPMVLAGLFLIWRALRKPLPEAEAAPAAR